MMLSRLTSLALLLILAGCGGDAVLKCEDNVAYLQARETPRIKAPDGLDDLDPLREVPLPTAAPQAPRAADAGCLEKPPSIIGN